MFKSIEYKLIIYLILLILSVVASTYFFTQKEIWYGSFFVLIVLFSIVKLFGHYKKFNQNILFLLNAIDNGDYSFNFSETKVSKREKELNQMLNKIKEILSKARQEVIENEKFLSLIVESVSTGIIILDEKNNVILTNNATTDLLGLHVLTHLNQLKVIDENYPELFKNLSINDNKQIKISNDREEIQIALKLSKISMKRGAVRIITLNNIGNELEAKEMESWIKLIRVMTHEIMNSIAPITSLSETLLFAQKSKENEDADIIEALETINSTAKGLISFVESYRKFTGIPKPQPKEFETVLLIEKILLLESSAINEKRIEVEIGKNKNSVMLNADEEQITQVLVNLIKNAVEAMEPNKNGKIKINISQQDNHTEIGVSNNGKPISEDTLPHIFIPFFTTKDSGNGIGLSISRYIMRLHGGKLQHSESLGWTKFSLIFVK